MNANFEVIGLTRLGINPESTAAPEADTLTTRSSLRSVKSRYAVKSYEALQQLTSDPKPILTNFFLA